MICAAHNAAEGRSHSVAERVGRERSEDGAVHPLPTNSGSLCLGHASAALGTVSPGAAASPLAIAKLVSRVWPEIN